MNTFGRTIATAVVAAILCATCPASVQTQAIGNEETAQVVDVQVGRKRPPVKATLYREMSYGDLTVKAWGKFLFRATTEHAR